MFCRSVLQDYVQQQELKEAGVDQPASKPNPWAGTANASAAPGSGQQPSSAIGMDTAKKGGGQILLFLLRLRQCCSHLSLMKSALDTDSLVEGEGLQLDLVEQMQRLALQEESTEEPNVTLGKAFQASSPSSKVCLLAPHCIVIM
jgi:transcription termination factor 2